jgi:hypothetical protein
MSPTENKNNLLIDKNVNVMGQKKNIYLYNLIFGNRMRNLEGLISGRSL